MPKFVFQLEAVLKQRAAVERTRQLAVAAVEQERAAAEEELRECQAGINRERALMRDMLAPAADGSARRVDLRGVRMQASSSLSLVGRISRGAYRLAGVHRRLEAARADLLKATTARKAVETLRERRYEEWVNEQKKKEAAALDELAVLHGAGKDPSSPEIEAS
jgi:flagellar FliJ protein